jgi:hypothetical protein
MTNQPKGTKTMLNDCPLRDVTLREILAARAARTEERKVPLSLLLDKERQAAPERKDAE